MQVKKLEEFCLRDITQLGSDFVHGVDFYFIYYGFECFVKLDSNLNQIL